MFEVNLKLVRYSLLMTLRITRIFLDFLQNPRSILQKLLTKVYSRLLLRTDMQILRFYNLEAFAYREKVFFKKIHSNEVEGIYLAKDGLIEHYFSPITRGRAYVRNFRNAASNIALSYGINRIEFEENDIVIDVGANQGNLFLYFDLYYSNLDLKYYAIEPGIRENKALSHSFKNKSNVQIFNFAAFNSCGSRDFYYSPNLADSSIHEPIEYEEKMLIQTHTLDCFLSQNLRSKSIKLVKIEAEGSEFEVCQGLLKNLKLIQYIAIDLGFERGLNQESPLPETTNLLLDNGFRLVAITQPDCLRILFENKSLINY